MIDLVNGFQDGIGINENKRIEFKGVEHVVEVIYEQLAKARWMSRFKHCNQVVNIHRVQK